MRTNEKRTNKNHTNQELDVYNSTIKLSTNVGSLCPVLFLTATTNQLDLIGPEWNGKKRGDPTP